MLDDWVEVSAADFKSILAFAEKEKQRQNALVSGPQNPLRRTESKLLQPGAKPVSSAAAAVGSSSAAAMADADESRDAKALSTGGPVLPTPPPSSGDPVIKYLSSIIALGGGTRKRISGNQFIGWVGATVIPSNSTGLTTNICAIPQNTSGANPNAAQRVGLGVRISGIKLCGYLDWEYAANGAGADRQTQRAVRCLVTIDRTPTLGVTIYGDATMPPTDENAITASYGIGTEVQCANRRNPTTMQRYHVLKDHIWEPKEWHSTAPFTTSFGINQSIPYAHRTERFDWWIPCDFEQIYSGTTGTSTIVNELNVTFAADTPGTDVVMNVKMSGVTYFTDAATTDLP